MKKLILIAILLLVSSTLAAQEIVNYTTYFTYNTATTTAQYTVSWDKMPEATLYDVRIRHVERNEIIQEKLNIYQFSYTFNIHRSGHFIVEVRSKNNNGESPWISSTNATYAKVGNDPQAWWIYRYNF